MAHMCTVLALAVGAMASPNLGPKMALMESSAEELLKEAAALADTVVNEISTQEWSKSAKSMPAPDIDLSSAIPEVEAWYINSDAATDRAACMETQLTEAGYAPLRFSALQTSNDCIENGIEDMPGLSKDEVDQAVSSWCNHKKLFEALSMAPSGPEHFLVFEDTPVISTHSMKKVVDDLLVHVDDPFSLLQLDPYGGIAQPVGFHRGRPLYKPSEDLENAHAYKGSHAMLVKKSALSQIVQLMNKRKASKVEDLVLQLPNAMSVSGGVALNPMINKFQERLSLPAHCKATVTTKKSSLMQSEAGAAEQDIWSLWPRDGAKTSIHNTAWWVPHAKSWFSLAETHEMLNNTGPSELLEVFQVGAHDEDPARAMCFKDALRARSVPPSRRMQLLQIPASCSAEIDAADYHACLTRNGLQDCTIVGKVSLDDFDHKVDWARRLQIRDHVTKSTCGFQRSLKQVGDGTAPYVLLLNENAVLGQDIKKHITSFIQANKEDVKGKAWRAIQLDPYGREAPIDQGLGAVWSQEKSADDHAKIADFHYLNDEESKSRFWGMHAVLLKREAIPTILAEMQMADGSAIGAVDRIPRHTEGWLAANLGVAYDPHMALLADECKTSRAEHFSVARSEIPERWTVQAEEV